MVEQNLYIYAFTPAHRIRRPVLKLTTPRSAGLCFAPLRHPSSSPGPAHPNRPGGLLIDRRASVHGGRSWCGSASPREPSAFQRRVQPQQGTMVASSGGPQLPFYLTFTASAIAACTGEVSNRRAGQGLGAWGIQAWRLECVEVGRVAPASMCVCCFEEVGGVRNRGGVRKEFGCSSCLFVTCSDRELPAHPVSKMSQLFAAQAPSGPGRQGPAPTAAPPQPPPCCCHVAP